MKSILILLLFLSACTSGYETALSLDEGAVCRPVNANAHADEVIFVCRINGTLHICRYTTCTIMPEVPSFPAERINP